MLESISHVIHLFFFGFANYIQLSKGFREIQRDTNVGFFIPSYQSDGWNIHQARNEIRRLILVRTGQYMKAWLGA